MFIENWHNLDIEKIKRILGTDIKEGLREKEVDSKRKKFGKNVISSEKVLSGLAIFLNQFKSPLIYILLIAGTITLLFKDYTDSAVIFGAVFLNAIFGFFQENKTSKIVSALKKMVKIKTWVIREGKEREIEQDFLVPGDIFILRPGDKIPADGRIIESQNLKISEMVLTGEWLPVEKNEELLTKKTILAERKNMVYMGTVVEEGRAKVMVTGTGKNTEIGKIADLTKNIKEEKTPYQKKIASLSNFIGIFVILTALFIFIIGILKNQDIFQMFLTSVAIAVAAIPEGLLIAITVILALGMQRILKKQGLIRKISAVETLGSTSVILTDKTGTLTEGKMQVAGIYTGTKELLSDGKNFTERIDKNVTSSHILTLKIAALCNEAFIENPDDSMGKWIVRGRSTDKALLLAGLQAGISRHELEKKEPKIKDFYFDPIYKYSASLHKLSDKENILYVVGAPEVIIKNSKYLYKDGKQKKINQKDVEDLNKKIDLLASKGWRVLGCAYSVFKKGDSPDEKGLNGDLTFVSLISLHDPLRKEVKNAINICKKAGIRTVIITGDHKLTAKAIASELGLLSKNENIIEGKDLDEMEEGVLREKVDDYEVFARVEPRQKMRIVNAWQSKGNVIAMTGDGVNDAPALKKADIGVALGSGTDVAKEASDLILLTDNFSIIVSAVEEGRKILDNIRKVITYFLSDSFTEVILIGVSIIANLPLPILPAQILWVNLIEDSLPALGLSFEPKEKGLMNRKPEKSKSPILNTEMKTLIFVIGLITDLLLLGLFLWLLSQHLPISEIRTIMFAGLTIDSLFYVFSCKNLRKNIWNINIFDNKILLLGWLWGIIMLFSAIYFPPLQNLLKTQVLNIFDWTLVLGLGIINLILIEITKYFFNRKKLK
ncbi:cation-translocating P-type ATPase [Patescibacteria group bacterium]